MRTLCSVLASFSKLMFNVYTEAEFKDFEPGLKFETRLKYGWFHLKLY